MYIDTENSLSTVAISVLNQNNNPPRGSSIAGKTIHSPAIQIFHQFLKKWIMIIIWNLDSETKLSGWLCHCPQLPLGRQLRFWNCQITKGYFLRFSSLIVTQEILYIFPSLSFVLQEYKLYEQHDKYWVLVMHYHSRRFHQHCWGRLFEVRLA